MIQPLNWSCRFILLSSGDGTRPFYILNRRVLSLNAQTKVSQESLNESYFDIKYYHNASYK